MVFNSTFVSLPVNDRGRDFCIGDLHGCRQMLDTLLLSFDFDRSRDRLFSVGDLIHRGPESAECLRLAEEPWFFPVLGNHEAMQLAAYSGAFWVEDAKFETGLEYLADANPAVIEAEHRRFLQILDNLPLAIETFLPDGRRIGIVHAGLRWPYTWAQVQETYRRDSDLDYPRDALQPSLIWDRLTSDAAFSLLGGKEEERISRLDFDIRCRHHYHSRPVAGLDLLISGHSQVPLAAPLKAGMRLFMDTGAGFPDGWLSMVELNSGCCWQVPSPLESSEPPRYLKAVVEVRGDPAFLSEQELLGLIQARERSLSRRAGTSD